ncbi:hypothetical protein VKT23_020666 [Stygiomarasmius scandens]
MKDGTTKPPSERPKSVLDDTQSGTVAGSKGHSFSYQQLMQVANLKADENPSTPESSPDNPQSGMKADETPYVSTQGNASDSDRMNLRFPEGPLRYRSGGDVTSEYDGGTSDGDGLATEPELYQESTALVSEDEDKRGRETALEEPMSAMKMKDRRKQQMLSSPIPYPSTDDDDVADEPPKSIVARKAGPRCSGSQQVGLESPPPAISPKPQRLAVTTSRPQMGLINRITSKVDAALSMSQPHSASASSALGPPQYQSQQRSLSARPAYVAKNPTSTGFRDARPAPATGSSQQMPAPAGSQGFSRSSQSSLPLSPPQARSASSKSWTNISKRDPSRFAK